MNPFRALFLTVIGVVLAVESQRSFAADYTVKMVAQTNPAPPFFVSFLFFPSNSPINVGDTITWTNAHTGAQHDATEGLIDAPFLWTSDLLVANSGNVFANTFDMAGSYPYRCMRHADTGKTPYHPEQTGMVMVATANLPPSVTLTNPINGSNFLAPATINLMANATDDGPVTNVQFLRGVTNLGNVTNPPFNLLLANLAAGNYAFSAVATDNTGLLATSPVVNVFVLTNSVITNFLTLSNGTVQFNVLGIKDQTYFIDASTNLTNWSVISTNFAPANLFPVTDPTAAGNGVRFYRTRQLSQ